ncbi:MAG: RsmB/NOP family class I SAM-dependent RNA methyltransferase [Lachnospiraceae bacterium]|nr:RsmB/NOP family class I SAM-dependent RNA methyltransferase [Lachnospiraceae bacterium]
MRENDKFDLPEAFARKMERLLGTEHEAFVQSYETERVQGLRFNTLHGSLTEMTAQCRERFGLTPVPWCREGFYYQAETRPGRHPFHEAGVYYIQEPSAMAVVSLLNPKPGERVLDLCAAPGGKTTHIAERLRGEGLLVSNEIHPARAKILSQNVERIGITNAVVTNEDSGKLIQYFEEFFDRIVVDAPCSGEGMFRKDEQARAQWSEDNVQLCVSRQQEILDNAARMLKKGGSLVYSTCTFSPEEDEGGIAAFLKRHPEFSIRRTDAQVELAGLSAGHPEWSEEPLLSLSDTFRIWPHKAEGEGHFMALLVKEGESDLEQETAAATKSKRAGKSGKSGGTKLWNEKEGRKVLGEFLREALGEEQAAFCEQGSLILFGEQIYRLPEGMPPLDGLRVLRPGLHLGTLKKNRFEPSHALALALRPQQAKQSVSFGAETPEIRAYLAGSTLSANEGQKGWVLVCVEDYSIGWAKAASGILKNHYPKGLRIL